MREPIPQWPDSTGRVHPTLEAAIIADIEALLGIPTANEVVAKAAELCPLIEELCDARAEKPPLRAVGAGSDRT